LAIATHVANSQYHLAVAGGCEASLCNLVVRCGSGVDAPKLVNHRDGERGGRTEKSFAPTRYREVVLTVRHMIERVASRQRAQTNLDLQVELT